MEIRSGVNLSILGCLSGYTGLTSLIPCGFMSFNWHSIILFQIKKKQDIESFAFGKNPYIPCLILQVKLDIIVLSFKVIWDLTLLASNENIGYQCKQMYKVEFKIQNLGGFDAGFICRCNMIFFYLVFIRSSRRIHCQVDICSNRER